MGRKSSVRRLPAAIRAEVDRLLGDGRYTIQQVTEHLQGLGHPVSKSALGRYSQHLERVTQDMRLAREMAQAVGRDLAEMPDGNVGRLVIESLEALLLRTRMQVAEDEELDPRKVALLTKSARDLAAAFKSSAETEFKIADRVTKEAAAVADRVGAEQGLSAATVDAIKEQILGIAKRP